MLDDFFIRALLAGIGIALVTGPLGCFIVWRRMAYFGDTMSHSALLGVALALLADVNPMLGVFAVAALVSLVLVALQRREMLSTDALLGILSHSALALGLVAVAAMTWLRVDLISLLFGDILAVTRLDLVLVYGGGAVVLAYDPVEAMPEETAGVIARRIDGPEEMPLSVRRALAQLRGGNAGSETRLIDGWLIDPVQRRQIALWVWGAGHVGRAIVATVAPLPDVAVTWVDTGADRFPDHVPDGVTIVPAADPARLAAHAPEAAHHLVLTYSHTLDLALCDALLRRGFASAGLIGSKSKWARFRSRLAAIGHASARIDSISCPIGDPALGKHPQEIAVGVAARLLRETQARQDAARDMTG